MDKAGLRSRTRILRGLRLEEQGGEEGRDAEEFQGLPRPPKGTPEIGGWRPSGDRLQTLEFEEIVESEHDLQQQNLLRSRTSLGEAWWKDIG